MASQPINRACSLFNSPIATSNDLHVLMVSFQEDDTVVRKNWVQ